MAADTEKRRHSVRAWAGEGYREEAGSGGIGNRGYREEIGRPCGTVGVVVRYGGYILCDDAIEREGETEDATEVGGEGFGFDVTDGGCRGR